MISLSCLIMLIKKTIDIDYIIIDLAGCSKNCLLLFVDLLLDTEISILTHTWLAK